MSVNFSTWTGDRSLSSMGTNNGAPKLSFQQWRHFKEAFAPELVARAIEESPIPVSRCLDPFGGSGTTALACQFLGVEPFTIEVNPYLADLIEAKLTSYDADSLVRDLGRTLRVAGRTSGETMSLPDTAPATMIEPGLNGRWIFDAAVAERIAALLKAMHVLETESHRRLFRVLLGGLLLDVSNVFVNGKGRRYRGRWKERRRDPKKVNQLFGEAVRRAVVDIHKFGDRAELGFTVVKDDARNRIREVPACELVVFSPPYPNSFDYTDVYNIELWVLGYLQDRIANRQLRQSTFCSHVQIGREFPAPPSGSRTLNTVIGDLCGSADKLWDRRIPDMVGGYFADLKDVLSDIRPVLDKSGTVWLVVGESRYADIRIPTATILEELMPACGFRTMSVEPVRSMRSSAQQGGERKLAESLLILTPARLAVSS